MSWTSTAEYYRLLNESVGQRLGGLHTARLLIHSVDFAEVDAMARDENWAGMANLLSDAARGLESAGAEAVLLAANTMHHVAPEIEAALNVPFFHIGEAIALRVASHGATKVGLIASAQDDSSYRAALADEGIELMRPDEVEQADITHIIYDELVHGVVRTPSRKRFQQIMARLDKDGADGIILADTEIQLLVRGEDADVPLYSSTQIHVEGAVAWMLG